MQKIMQVNLVNKKSAVMIIIVIAAVFFLFMHRADDPWFLVIQDPRSEVVLFEVPVEPGDTITLRYTHSVSRSPVEGTFLLTEKGLIEPLTTSYTAYGPGLPVERYVNWQIENDTIKVYHEEEPRQSIRLWATSLSQETLLVADQVFPLYNDQDNFLVEIYVVPPLSLEQ